MADSVNPLNIPGTLGFWWQRMRQRMQSKSKSSALIRPNIADKWRLGRLTSMGYSAPRGKLYSKRTYENWIRLHLVLDTAKKSIE